MMSECEQCKKLQAKIDKMKAKKEERIVRRESSSDGPEAAFARAQALDHTLNTF
jgi:hypothetical protein